MKPTTDPQQLVFLLTRAHSVYQVVLRNQLEEFELDRYLRPGMGNVLFALFARNGQTVGELSAGLGVPKSTMTGIIAGLESSGVIRSQPGEYDQRVKRLYLTSRGRSLEPRCRDLTARLTDVFAGHLDGDDIDRFNHLLTTLLERLTTAAES